MQCFKFIVLLLLTSCLNALVEAKARDYYEVLNVDRNDDVKKIKKAFKKLALKHHPDKNPKNKKAAEEKFMEINNAYQVLCDPIKREKYDKSGGDTEFESKQQSHSFHGQGFSFNFDDVFQGFNEGFGGSQAFPFSHFTEQVHHSQQHGKQNYFTIHDFFQEDEDRFHYHDRGHREDRFGSRDSFFGSHFGAHGQPNRGDSHMYRQAQSQARGRGHFHERMATRCRSVTQRVGDIITTFTDCS